VRPIIVLDGASSSGRTSLAREFAAGEYRAYHIDEFVCGLPADVWQRCSTTSAGWVEIATLFHEFLFERWSAGERIIADCFFASDEARQHLFERFGCGNVFHVQLYCELEELERRECARGDRRNGLARSQFHAVYAFEGFDLRIDSTRMRVEECAALLAEAVGGGPG
jgi:chloramphenicol 3-O phosphotransferase